MAKVKKLKTKKGGYKVDVTDKDGKRYRLHFAKRDEAVAFTSKLEQEKADFKLFKRGLMEKKISVQDAIDQIMKTKKDLAPGSLKKYTNIYHQFALFTQNEQIIYVNNFTRDHADKFDDLLKDSGAKPKTTNGYLTAIKALFNYQVNKDRIIKNPFSHIENIKIKKKTLLEKENEYFNEDDIKLFFSQEMNDNYRSAFTALFLTGMRFDEMASLKWGFVVLESGIIQIRETDEFKPKTETSERDVPMSDYLKRLLTEMKSSKTSDFVFPSVNNKKMPESTLLQACKRIAKCAEIKKNATVHMWRHTFNSIAQQVGIPFEERQYLMGHKPTTMTGHYTKIDPTKLHHKLSKLDEYIK